MTVHVCTIVSRVTQLVVVVIVVLLACTLRTFHYRTLASISSTATVFLYDPRTRVSIRLICLYSHIMLSGFYQGAS